MASESAEDLADARRRKPMALAVRDAALADGWLMVAAVLRGFQHELSGANRSLNIFCVLPLA